jgi:hypothetical protein
MASRFIEMERLASIPTYPTAFPTTRAEFFAKFGVRTNPIYSDMSIPCRRCGDTLGHHFGTAGGTCPDEIDMRHPERVWLHPAHVDTTVEVAA